MQSFIKNARAAPHSVKLIWAPSLSDVLFLRILCELKGRKLIPASALRLSCVSAAPRAGALRTCVGRLRAGSAPVLCAQGKQHHLGWISQFSFAGPRVQCLLFGSLSLPSSCSSQQALSRECCPEGFPKGQWGIGDRFWTGTPSTSTAQALLRGMRSSRAQECFLC